MCIIVSVDFMKLKMPLQRADADKMICWPAFQADILILSHIRWHHRGVAEECPPALSGTTPPPHHIFGNAGLADIDANLEKLAMDPRCSPQRINDAHLADKLAYFYRHGRSSAAVLRFPSPIRSKSRTVPTDYGLRSDDCKWAIHLGKQSADASQYQPVDRNKSKPRRISASQHIDLLP